MDKQNRDSEELSSKVKTVSGQTLSGKGDTKTGNPAVDTVLDPHTGDAGLSSDHNDKKLKEDGLEGKDHADEDENARDEESNALAASSPVVEAVKNWNEDGEKAYSEKSPLAPTLPKRPPSTLNRRSHSFDHSELSGIRDIISNENVADSGFVQSSASTGVLDESDRLETDEGPAAFPPEVLDALSNPNLDEDTPVAAALRANANVHVSNVSKLARRMKAQNIRRFVKRAALIGKSGQARGKPPRAPPFRGAENDVIGGSMPNIYSLKEEEGGDRYMDSSIDSENEPSAGGSAGSRDALKLSEYTISAPAAVHQRSSSQPTLSDTSRNRNRKDFVDKDDIHHVVDAQRDSTAATRVGFSQVHSGAADGIPMEVHTSPDGSGRAKLHLGKYRGMSCP